MESHSFSYVECDIPEGMTLDEWRRRHRTGHAERPFLARLRRAGRGAPVHA
jgi:hypothetical protein